MAFLTTTVGLALFAVFRNCDPLNEKSGIGLTKADQIVPYYIVSRLISYPGLVGLCISGILCASISSLSSALNSLSTVFVEDFINTSFPSHPKASGLKLNALAKALVIMHGISIIGLAFMTSRFMSVLQAVIVLDGMVLGPTLGVYILGVFTERSNELGVLIGLTIAALSSAWFGLGTSLFGNTYEGLPFHNEDCISEQSNVTDYSYSSLHLKSEATNSTLSVDMMRYFPMYRISYIWTYCIGVILTILIGYIISRIIDCQKKPATVDPKLLCPLVKSRHSQIPKDNEMHSQTIR
ncbi:Sodium-coupled monocarboxylate transporter 1 [Araneus ventricosus]|uniref:Sodium-coupled monocarboxylate transporter 1 n=1 Tax=Araneus ventricosus TaxID=182803 RepID=A0A4Y2GG02_ARAVE|nr:Sodium-coupled monocarboxylate transporter 1 [Araneus ventricosus]